MTDISVSLTEYYALWGAVSTVVILIGLLIVVNLWTPALIFLKAIFKRLPVMRIHFRTGKTVHRIATEPIPGILHVKRFGVFFPTEDSYTREHHSGVIMYDAFAENAHTVPKWWPAVIQELRESGIAKINNYEDYKNLLDAITNQEQVDQVIDNLKTKEEKEKYKSNVKQLRSLDIPIKPWKTYKMHELAYMFPNNQTPISVETYKDTALSNEARKKENLKVIIFASIGVLIIGIAFAIIWKAIGDPHCPAVAVKCGTTGVEMAKTAVQNITI